MQVRKKLENLFKTSNIIEPKNEGSEIRTYYVIQFLDSESASKAEKQIQEVFQKKGFKPSDAKAGILQADDITFVANNNLPGFLGKKLMGTELYLDLSTDTDIKLQSIADQYIDMSVNNFSQNISLSKP